MKWIRAKVIEIVKECREAGLKFAGKKLVELRLAGPKYVVTTSFGDQKSVGTMLDVCGFAHLHISARGKFFQLAKKLSHNDHSLRFNCDNEYGGGGWFSVYDTSMRQEMSVNVAACKGIQEVLLKYGIESTVRSRID